jgi:hypothetical protein
MPPFDVHNNCDASECPHHYSIDDYERIVHCEQKEEFCERSPKSGNYPSL